MQHSIKAFEEAIEFGRSYQDSYINLCNINIEFLENELYDKWSDDKPLFEKTYQSCKDSIEILSSKSFSLNKITELLLRYTDFLSEIGVDITEYLHWGLEWNKQALEIDSNPYTYKMKAFLYDSLAVERINSGLQPNDEIQQAMMSYQKAIELQPRFLAKHSANILYTLINKVQYMIDHGESISSEVEYADKIFIQAIESGFDTKSENLYLYVNFGLIQNLMAQSERRTKGQALKWIEKSLSTYQQVLKEPVNTSFVKSGIIENKILKAKIQLNKDNDISNLIDDIHNGIAEIKEELSPYSWFQLNPSRF